MKSIMEYLIEAEESALDQYLNDTMYEYGLLNSPLEFLAFEDISAGATATLQNQGLGLTRNSNNGNTAPATKEKFSLWEWIKKAINNIGQFFLRILGIAKDTKEAANNAASGAGELKEPRDSDTVSNVKTAKSVKPALRSVKPRGEVNTNPKGNTAAYRTAAVERLNRARASYADATKKAIGVIFNAASATCAFIDKMRSKWSWKVPSGKAFNDEFARIEELYENAAKEYESVTNARDEYDKVKENLKSFGNLSRHLTWMNINDVNAICDKIEAACKKHYDYCNNFTKSIDAAKSKFNEDMKESEKNFYAASKQYLKIATLANKATADFRKCVTEVYNGDKL